VDEGFPLKILIPVINRMAHLLDRPFEEKSINLVMVYVFVGFSQILLGFLVEGFLATKRTEVVSLAFILGLASGCRGVNVHTADGIMYCSCHNYLLLYVLIITLIDISTTSRITR
jgi:hypothetical protein